MGVPSRYALLTRASTNALVAVLGRAWHLGRLDRRISQLAPPPHLYRRPDLGPAVPDQPTRAGGITGQIESKPIVAVARKPRYVDVTNPSLSVECPHCGLLTARFIDHCRNCGYKLWPSSVMAAAAFKVWRDADPSRAMASRFDLEVPVEPLDATIDYAARAHELGIHLFPNSNYPFIICVGALFLALAAIPFSNIARLVLAVIGGLIFLYGVVGWVLVEDVRMFPVDNPQSHGEVHH